VLENQVTINGINYNLQDIEKDCWLQLLNGSVKSRIPFHTPTVATFGNEGISIRTVVLRKTNVAEKQLIFHTDTRSQKWQEIKNNATVAIHFYDAATRVQIRIDGTATLHHTDAIADEAWNKSNLSCKRTYMTNLAPSSTIEMPASGLTEYFETHDPTAEEAAVARPFFGLVSIQALALDWLWLNNKGHRRAKFFYEKGALKHSSWIAP